MRKLLVLTMSMLAAAVIGGAAAPGASALTQVDCTGTNTSTFSPAVTNTPQTVTITSHTTFGTCLSLTHPAITSGSVPASTVTTTSSCTQLLGAAAPTFTITWNTGQTSTISATTSTEKVDGQPVGVLVGSVTSGLFAGATATEQIALNGDLTACLGSGLTGVSGPAVLTIAGL